MAMAERRRQFVREVGSVVLGVIIALGIGEAADSLRWKFRVRSSMESIRYELSQSHFNLVERLAYQDCLDKRLTEIGTVLGAARHTGLIPEVSTVGRPSARLFNTAAFEVAKSEGVPAHMNRAEAHGFAVAYAMTDVYRDVSEKERGTWAKLQLLEGPGGPVSESLLTTLLEAWVDARASAWLLQLAAQQGAELLIEVGAPMEYPDETPNQAAFADHIQSKSSTCQPMLDVVVPPVATTDPP